MKKIIALVLALMMAFSLVACGGKDRARKHRYQHCCFHHRRGRCL